MLLAQGLTPLDVHAHRGGIRSILAKPVGWSRNGSADRAVLHMLRDLRRLLNAGVRIDSALRLVGKLSADRFFSATLSTLREDIRKGATLASAMEAHPKYFDVHLVAMIAAAEISGTLPETLDTVTNAMSRELDFKDQLRRALAYPALLVVLAGVTTVLIAVFVLPQFEQLFDTAQVDSLPTATRVVMWVGDGIRVLWAPMTLLCLALGAWLVWAVRSDQYRVRIDEWIIRHPLLRSIIAERELIRTLHTLGTSLEGGVKLDAALRLSMGATRNTVLMRFFDHANAAVREGGSLAPVVASTGWMPELVTQLVRVGEETGRLGSMLLEATAILESHYWIRMQQSLGVLGPAVTLIMGVVIAVLISGVLVGMLSMNDVLA